MEAEKAKEINSNFKKFLEAISKALKKADDAPFCDQVEDYQVREAKKDVERQDLFPKLVKKMFKKEKSNITGKEFVKLVTAFTKSLKEAKCSEIFNHLTKKPESPTRTPLGGANIKD